MKIIILLLLSLNLAACSTVILPKDSGKYAPKTDKPNHGTVAYNPDGISEVVDVRRNDALKKIFNICGSNNYKIVKEEVRIPSANEKDRLATLGSSQLNYVDFECK